MLLPVVRRIFSGRLLPRTKLFFVEFNGKNIARTTPCCQRLLCTVEKADEGPKSEESEELSELDKKVKLIEEKDLLLKDLEVIKQFLVDNRGSIIHFDIIDNIFLNDFNTLDL